MNKLLYDMLFVNNELSQNKFNNFIVMVFGIIIGGATFILKVMGHLDSISDLLTYSATLILAALGFYGTQTSLRERDAQRYGSTLGQMPKYAAKNPKEE